MTVRADQHPVLWFPAPHFHEQCLQHNICHLSALHRPANHAAGIQVDDNSQIAEALIGLYVGDICHPSRVRCVDINLAVKRVIHDDRWLPTI